MEDYSIDIDDGLRGSSTARVFSRKTVYKGKNVVFVQ